MGNRGALTKLLAIVGTWLVWLPLLMPALLATILLLRDRVFRFDWLMPAELFPAALIGGGLLLCAARRARLPARLIGLALVVAVASLLGSQAIAVVTGLASGALEPAGWPWVLVLTLLLAYVLAVAAVAADGIRLVRDLLRRVVSPS